MSLQLTLLFDPLCGWCYGAHPALAAVDRQLAPDWHILPTGLFAHPQPMTAERARYFWSNDQRIAALTGQTFSTAYREQVLTDLATPFDSSAATLAWQLIHAQRPRQGLAVLHRLQAMRYVDGLSYTPENLQQLATEFGLDANAFASDLARGVSPAHMQQRELAQQRMRQHGLQGVPAMLVQVGDRQETLDSRLLYDPAALTQSLTRLMQ